MRTHPRWQLSVFPVTTLLIFTAGALVLACGGDKVAGPPTPVVAAIQVSPGTDTLLTLGRTRQFAAQARDANGNPMSGVTFVWRSSNPGVATVDSVTGIVTAVGNGLSLIRAVASGVTGQATLAVSQVVAMVQVTPGSAGLSTVGATQQFVAVAKDSGGATVPGVRFVWQSSDQQVATVDTNGVALSKGAGQSFITAAGRGIPGNAVLTVTQSANRLAFIQQPVSTTAGQAFSPAIQVEIRDASDHVVTGAANAVTLSVTGHPGALLGTTTVNATHGVATFSGLKVTAAGVGYTLTADASGLSAATGTAFDVTPGAPGRLLFTRGPAAAEAGAALDTVAVAIRDSFGNTVPTGSITLTIAAAPWSGSGLQGTVSQGAVGGVAKFADLSLLRPGRGYVLAATIVGGGATVIATSVPFDVTVTFVSVAVGSRHACGIATGGRTFCWGGNSSREIGALSGALDSVPILVPGGIPFTQVVAGASASCGLTAGGAAYCWGGIALGQLGDSGASATNTAIPVPVVGGHQFVVLAAGNGHFCGLLVDSTAYCWGYNNAGQLGIGNTFTRSYPVAVSGGLHFKQIAAGANHTCALIAGGAAYCWGDNSGYQLGDSTTTQRLVPVPVHGGKTFTALAAGSFHTCGLTGTGPICWGDNSFAELGTGNNTATQPIPFLYVAGPPFVATGIAAGQFHTCVIGSYQAAGCWGSGLYGQLGNLSSANQSFATLTAGGLRFSAIAANAGGSFTCGREYLTGHLYCWGANDTGQLGDGSTLGRYEPVLVIQ
jgi:alpha-tubulin suppressor-like RCC1 family protein/uncharacterized protein YjdB